MLFFIRFLFAPLYFLGFIGTSIIFVANGLPYICLAALLILAICVSFCAEKTLPYELAWNKANNDVPRDLLHAIINEASNALAIAMIPLLSLLIPTSYFWPLQWPLWCQLLLAILVADFGITIAHYLSHKIQLLWKFHAVHHSLKRMYAFNGLMKHPLHQAFELVAGTTPLLIMGMPIEVAALLGFAVAIQLTLQHSNVDMNVGPLIYLWAVAPGHRHHHIASKLEGNVNFGLFTMIWDHLLGTFVHGRPTPRSGELGIDGHADFPTNYAAQLLHPFRR